MVVARKEVVPCLGKACCVYSEGEKEEGREGGRERRREGGREGGRGRVHRRRQCCSSSIP